MNQFSNSSPDKPWTLPWQEILESLDVSRDKGLNAEQVESRRKQYGLNSLREIKSKSVWLIFTDQFKSLITLLLAVAVILSFVFGELVEGVAIVAVIFINALIGFFTELRAVRSMEALRRLGSINAKVRRDGHVLEIPSHELVPGDIVIIEGGDVVTADLRLVEASKLQADESSLTGESFPVSKRIEPLNGEVPLAERSNMLFRGTSITRGSGEGVVVATGMGTELGQISSLVEEAVEEKTPLEKRLDQLGQELIWVTLAITAAVAVIGILRGKETFLMIETAIALAVAAIPEGLPIVATIALARGMMRMARRNALINRLSAVEALGATDVICTDKTGTLTENQMTVTRIALESGEVEISGEGFETKGVFAKGGETLNPLEDSVLRTALEVGLLCGNASLKGEKQETDERRGAIGDPVEVALLVAGAKAGMDRDSLLQMMPEVREEAFDPDVKMMATFHKEDSLYRVAVKGAPEPVLESCSLIKTESGEKEISDEDCRRWLNRNNKMAEEGLRVLALAIKAVDSPEVEPYDNLTFLGLVGFLDPPRGDVRQAIVSCRDSGIKVIMVTGDHPITARNIAQAVGLIGRDRAEVIQGKELENHDKLHDEDRRHLLQATIFARVSPKQKLGLISLHQGNGSIVAMTGDGVNDAPALKKADIGIAMGKRGTQVAREAADMVLKDDAFSTIVVAVEQGRVIFNNIRKFVFYLLSCNVSEIMVVSLASFVNAPLPILPLQILFLNLVTDVFPALALGVGEGDPEVMKRSPRNPKEPILTRRRWLSIGGYGSIITVSVLGAFALALSWLKMEEKEAVTISFLTLAFSQLFHVFNMRDRGSRFLRNDVTRNPYIWGAFALCALILLGAVYIPGFAVVLSVADPGLNGWVLVLVMSIIPLVIGQIFKSCRV
ncbi:MAG TPA: cation-transporting P-type ATPase [Thermodesulfobacteriota bacterium]|nr:cation-transporting P-type ATPase [Thermodesulfobacteriota bacterium]